MRYFAIFIKKETLELWRTYRGIIVCVIFIFLAILSPLLAKMMPAIFMSQVEGMEITIADPTAYDSYVQWYSNVQLGIIMILIMFAGSLTQEKKRGTAGLLTAKGLPRRVVALGKLVSAIAVWSVGYWLGFGVCYGYTMYLFPDQAVEKLALAMTAVWFFGVMLLCVAFCLSTIFKSSGGPIGISIALVMLVFPLLDLWKDWAKISPNWLGTDSIKLLATGQGTPQDALGPFLVAAAVCVVSVMGMVFCFKKNEL